MITTEAPTERRMPLGVKIVLVLAAIGVGLVIAAVVVVIVVVSLQNRAPDVPADFEAPVTLPPTALPAPAGTLYFDSDRTGTFEIYRSPVPGAEAEALTDDPAWDSWWPRLSPDRERVLFYRSPAGIHDTDFNQTHLWVMNADGTEQLELRPPGLDGWVQQGHAEWSPDGSRLVMFGGSRTNPQIFLTGATGQSPVAVTERGGTNLDPSFAPDGRTVAFIGCPETFCMVDDYEVYAVDISGPLAGGDPGEPRRLTDDAMRDHDPYYSPDGTQIAWLTQTSPEGRHPGGSWNIRIADADGSNLRRLTDDDQINSKPEWSRDGTTIYFHRLELPRLSGFSIFAIDVDGTDLREITVDGGGVNEFPST